MSWALALLQANRPAWKAAFTALGSNDQFNLIQKQQAIAHYHGRALIVISNLRTISPALMANVEVRSYLAIFDLCVQQNGIDKVLDAIKAKVAAGPPATQVDLVKIAAEQRALIAKAAFVADCMSRRLGILAGKAVSLHREWRDVHAAESAARIDRRCGYQVCRRPVNDSDSCCASRGLVPALLRMRCLRLLVPTECVS